MTCLQLALHAKCEVYGTCGNAEKAKMLKEKGAHHVINYSTSDFEAEVKKLTNGEGVDIIIDAVGGSYFKKDLNILSTNGKSSSSSSFEFSTKFHSNLITSSKEG
jgi:NADPH2:quinone reductase